MMKPIVITLLALIAIGTGASALTPAAVTPPAATAGARAPELAPELNCPPVIMAPARTLDGQEVPARLNLAPCGGCELIPGSCSLKTCQDGSACVAVPVVGCQLGIGFICKCAGGGDKAVAAPAAPSVAAASAA